MAFLENPNKIEPGVELGRGLPGLQTSQVNQKFVGKKKHGHPSRIKLIEHFGFTPTNKCIEMSNYAEQAGNRKEANGVNVLLPKIGSQEILV